MSTISIAQDLLDSHPVSVPTSLQNSTPESSNSDSPDQACSGSNYSPVSNPYAERPSRRTSAGEAALVVANMPPSPPPFTPAESVSAGHPAYSGGSCGSRSHAGGDGSPGITSRWAGSSTKTTQPQSFAFAPHMPGDNSPDVQPFKTSPEAAQPLASMGVTSLVQGALHNAAVDSYDTDNVSEQSESAASRSSVTSRGSGARYAASGGQSPVELLKKAKALVEKQAAVGGSSRLQRGRKKGNAMTTPMDKGIPATVTPNNTPMDVLDDNAGDQVVSQAGSVTLDGGLSPTVGLPAVAVSDTPGSVSFAGKPSVLTSPSKGQSPPMSPGSRTSDVSIGSICEAAAQQTVQQHLPQQLDNSPMPDASRKLDFSAAATPIPVHHAAAGSNASPAVAAALAGVKGLAGQDVADTGSPGADWSPTPLDELGASMLDSVTKKALRLDRDLEGSWCSDPDTASFISELSAGVGQADMMEAKQSRTSKALAFGLTAGFLIFASFLAVQMLPPTVGPAGSWCLEGGNNLQQACSAASKAYWAQADTQPSGLQLFVLRAKWYMEDAWDILIRRRVPQGVTKEQVVRVWFDKISEAQIQQMPPALAAELFTDLPPHMVTPLIRAKLGEHDAEVQAAEETAGAAVTQHAQDPEAGAIDEFVAEDLAQAGDVELGLEHEEAPDSAREWSDGSELPQVQQDRQAEKEEGADPGAIADTTKEDVVPAAQLTTTALEDMLEADADAALEDARPAGAGTASEDVPPADTAPENVPPADAGAASEHVPPAGAGAASEDARPAGAGAALEGVLPADAGSASEDVPTADAGAASEGVLPADAGSASEDVPTADAGAALEGVLPADAGSALEDVLLAGQDVASGVAPLPEHDMAQPPSAQMLDIAQPAEQEAAPATLSEVMIDSVDSVTTAIAAQEMPHGTPSLLDDDVPAEAAEEPTDAAEQAQMSGDHRQEASVANGGLGVQQEQQYFEPPAGKPLKFARRWSYALMVVVAGAAVAYGCCVAWLFFKHNHGLFSAAADKAGEAAAPEAPNAEVDDGPLLSDEEDERPARSRQRRQRQSGTAAGTPLGGSTTAAAQAVAAAVRVLTPSRRAPLSAAALRALHLEQGGGRAAARAGTAAETAGAEAAEQETAEQVTAAAAPAVEGTPAHGRGAGRRRTSSRATASGGAAGAAAAAAEADGEEVSVPRSSGRRRGVAAASPRRGRLSALPENQPALELSAAVVEAAEEPLLSDEEPPATARSRQRRVSGSSAAAGSRRRSGAAAEHGDSATPATPRRSTRSTR